MRFVHPREPTALLDDEDVAADQAYPPYWAEVWESGVELAHAVSARDWTGATVLELGAGSGCRRWRRRCSGARGWPTDRAADALAFAGANAAENGVAVETALCAWSDPTPLLALAPWDLVLAADVLYGQRGVDELTPAAAPPRRGRRGLGRGSGASARARVPRGGAGAVGRGRDAPDPAVRRLDPPPGRVHAGRVRRVGRGAAPSRRLADELGRSVVINDPAVVMLYASRHFGDEDRSASRRC